VFEMQQKTKKKKMAKQAKKVEPLFLLRSAEQKLNSLRALLYGDPNDPTATGRVVVDENTRKMIAQLEDLVANYSNGNIPLKTYQHKLTLMLNRAQEMRAMQLERIV
jgi:hypothetical protein